MRTYAIYKATNKINGKVYIGTTNQFSKRIWQHQRCYQKEDCVFHRAIKEFGFDNFEWDIIDETDNLEESFELEKKYIKEYDSFRNGYNMTKGGRGSSMWNAKPVVRLTLDGRFVERYDSSFETKKQGFHDSTVLLVCKGKGYSHKGFIFMFEDDYKKMVQEYMLSQNQFVVFLLFNAI